jgi:membrane protease YdiL (CAAX protease family)
MGDTRSLFSLYGKSALYQLFVSLLIVLVTGILLFTVFILAGMLIFDADLGSLRIGSSPLNPKEIGFLRYIFISQQVSLFIVPAVIILFKLNPEHQFWLKNAKIPLIKDVLLVIALAFCIFPVTSFAGQLNSGMHLPGWLSGAEQWMAEKEDNATRLVDAIITPETFWGMILNLMVLAVIPAIGEELIFRGVFQKILSDLFKSGHLAIWVTAFVFSTLHFQFFGFLPRFILGLVFGYLFFWSGTLWLPVISHFVNNAVPTIGAYIHGLANYHSAESIPFWKQFIVLPLPVIISIVILLYFRNNYMKDAGAINDQAQFTNI